MSARFLVLAAYHALRFPHRLEDYQLRRRHGCGQVTWGVRFRMAMQRGGGRFSPVRNFQPPEHVGAAFSSDDGPSLCDISVGALA